MGVARARAHPDRRIAQPGAGKRAIRGTTSTSTRSSPGSSGDVLLSARNTWTLYDVDIHSGAITLAPGRRPLELQAGVGHALLLAARRRVAARRADLDVRQRLQPAEGEAVARPAAGTEPSSHTVSLVKAFTNPSRTLLAASQGNTLEPARRQLADGLRATCRTSPSTTPPATCCSTARSARTSRTSAPTSRRGAAIRRPRRGRSRCRRRRLADRLGELERRHRSRRAGACWRAPPPSALAPVATVAAARLRDHDQGARDAGPYVAVQALDASGARARHLGGGQSLIRAHRARSLAAVAGTRAGPAGGVTARRLRSAPTPRAGARRRRAPRRPRGGLVRARRRLNGSARAGGSRVTVSPLPGDPRRLAAHPDQLPRRARAASSRTCSVARLAQRRATRAGCVAYSQGDGASFVPARPFRPGERVASTPRCSERRPGEPVRVLLHGRRARHASAKRAAARRPAPEAERLPELPLAPGSAPADGDGHGARARHGDRGELLLAPYSGPGQYGPMILDEHGGLRLVQAAGARRRPRRRPARPELRRQTGADLVAGPARHRRAAAAPGIVIDDTSYNQIAVVRAGNGYQADLHEFQITPQGTALITVYDGIECNLSAVGGPARGAVADTLMQELDLATGLVRYEWHSLDHVPLSDTYVSPRPGSLKEPFDFFHINSIDVHARRLAADRRAQHLGRLRRRRPHGPRALAARAAPQQLQDGARDA